MTNDQINRIYEMRELGVGYGKISQILNVSENTVKSFCKRKGLGGVRVSTDKDLHLCKHCGKEVQQNPGRKEKKFCSDKCRMAYWAKNPDGLNHKAVYEYVCPECGKPFTAYGNSHRKYCCRRCYMIARHGYREYWDKKKGEKVWQI